MLFAGVRGIEVVAADAVGVHFTETGNVYAASSVVNAAFAIIILVFKGCKDWRRGNKNF